MQTLEGQAEAGPRGVGGWLLLLCLGLTVFSPLLTIVNFAQAYSQSSAYFGQFPGLLVVTIIDTVLSAALMVFSIYAGVGLWRVRPGAVRIAKRYMIAVLAYSFIAIPLPFMAGLPSAANDVMVAEVAKSTIRLWIGVAVWYSYLCKSKRVKATYVEATS